MDSHEIRKEEEQRVNNTLRTNSLKSKSQFFGFSRLARILTRYFRQLVTGRNYKRDLMPCNAAEGEHAKFAAAFVKNVRREMKISTQTFLFVFFSTKEPSEQTLNLKMNFYCMRNHKYGNSILRAAPSTDSGWNFPEIRFNERKKIQPIETQTRKWAAHKSFKIYCPWRGFLFPPKKEERNECCYFLLFLSIFQLLVVCSES